MLKVSPRFGATLETLVETGERAGELLSGQPSHFVDSKTVLTALDTFVSSVKRADFRKLRDPGYKISGGRGAVAISPKNVNEFRILTREGSSVGGYTDYTHRLAYDAGLEKLVYERSWRESSNIYDRLVTQTETLTVSKPEIEGWLAAAQLDAKTKAFPWSVKVVKEQARQERLKVREMEQLLAAFDKLARQAKNVQPQPKICPAKA